MWKTSHAFHKTVTIAFSVNEIVFALFGIGSPVEVDCFDYSLVSVVYHWIHVSSAVTKRRRNSFELRLNRVKHISCPICHAEYDIRCLWECLQSHLFSTPSIGGLLIRDRGLLSHYLGWNRFRNTWTLASKTDVLPR